MTSKQIGNDLFIETVKCNDVLFDITHADYKNIFMKNKLWDEIGEKFNMSGEDAKGKWKNLRDSYSKYLKSLQNPASHTCYSRYSKWQWASSMEFLKEYMGLASFDTSMKVHTEETENINGKDSQIITEPEIKKDNEKVIFPQNISAAPSNSGTSQIRPRKRSSDKKVFSYFNNSKVDRFSSTEHIMLGYAKTIDDFTNRRKIITKMRIAQVMMEAELEEEQERSQQDRTESATALRYCQTVYSASEPNRTDHSMNIDRSTSDSTLQVSIPIQVPSSSQTDLVECVQIKVEPHDEDNK